MKHARSAILTLLLAGCAARGGPAATSPAAGDLPRPALNRASLELGYPFFWSEDRDRDGALDPGELALVWGLNPRPREHWVKDGRFTAAFLEAYARVRARATSPEAPPDARQAALAKELAQSYFTGDRERLHRRPRGGARARAARARGGAAHRAAPREAARDVRDGDAHPGRRRALAARLLPEPGPVVQRPRDQEGSCLHRDRAGPPARVRPLPSGSPVERGILRRARERRERRRARAAVLGRRARRHGRAHPGAVPRRLPRGHGGGRARARPGRRRAPEPRRGGAEGVPRRRRARVPHR